MQLETRQVHGEKKRVMETNGSQFWIQMTSPEHPVWGIIKPCVATGLLILLLKANATNFDLGEVRTAVGTGLGMYLLEMIRGRKKA